VIDEQPDQYVCTAPNGLKGARYIFPTISVTGTETLLMAALLAEGETVLENVAIEPEVIELAQQCVSWGARISGIGTTTLRIQGGELLTGGTVRVLPDRIEAGSLMMLAVATKSQLRIEQCRPDHLTIPISVLERMGVQISVGDTWLSIDRVPTSLAPIDIITHEYPGFPTDLQSPMTVVLTQAQGQSVVRETIYDGRLFYTDSLNSMGAAITLLDPYRAIVQGATKLYGQPVASPDIRAGLAMIIAGLIAEGETVISNIYQIDRGYEDIAHRLSAIGADIVRR
jgi:UDP-N-acetylglucosamine 1-carboxyvinyltransferase